MTMGMFAWHRKTRFWALLCKTSFHTLGNLLKMRSDESFQLTDLSRITGTGLHLILQHLQFPMLYQHDPQYPIKGRGSAEQQKALFTGDTKRFARHLNGRLFIRGYRTCFALDASDDVGQLADEILVDPQRVISILDG